MVAVAVRSVDRRQVLAARRDPIHERTGLLDGDEGVDQNGVPLAVDEGRRYRRPHPLFRAWRRVADDNGYAGRHEHVPLQKLIHIALLRVKSDFGVSCSRNMTAFMKAPCSANLFRVLRLTVAKRPVLFADFNQIDEHVLPAQAQTLVQSVRNCFVKGTFLVHGSPGIERDLHKHAIFRSLNAKVAGIKDEVLRWMLGDDLEAIVFRGLQDLNHSLIDHFSDGPAVVDRLTLCKINSSQWHDKSPLRGTTYPGQTPLWPRAWDQRSSGHQDREARFAQNPPWLGAGRVEQNRPRSPLCGSTEPSRSTSCELGCHERPVGRIFSSQNIATVMRPCRLRTHRLPSCGLLAAKHHAGGGCAFATNRFSSSDTVHST